MLRQIAFFGWIVVGLSNLAFAQEPDTDTNRERFVVAALGDSVTRAFNSDRWLSDSPERSWVTGSIPERGFLSHFMRLRSAFHSEKVETANVARTGAVARELTAQINRILPLKPKYVTYM